MNTTVSENEELANQEISNLNKEETIENNQISENKEVSNGLENFGLDDEAPELFNSDSKDNNDQEFTSFDDTEKKEEEDDLEIPAFLRRQKN